MPSPFFSSIASCSCAVCGVATIPPPNRAAIDHSSASRFDADGDEFNLPCCDYVIPCRIERRSNCLKSLYCSPSCFCSTVYAKVLVPPDPILTHPTLLLLQHHHGTNNKQAIRKETTAEVPITARTAKKVLRSMPQSQGQVQHRTASLLTMSAQRCPMRLWRHTQRGPTCERRQQRRYGRCQRR